jgi:hypothetical protein
LDEQHVKDAAPTWMPIAFSTPRNDSLEKASFFTDHQNGSVSAQSHYEKGTNDDA